MLVRRFLDGVEILSLEINSLRDTLKDIASLINSRHPQVRQIILFGSIARSNFTPYSDVDIAIIVNNTSKNFIKRQDDFIDYFTNIPLDVNLVVYTMQEVENMLKKGNTFIKEVLSGCKLLT